MSIPLFERYPETAALSRIELCELPTPLGELSLDGVGALQVKRDDLTSSRYGGNKVRKLEFLLGKALKEDRKAVITFGAYGSNHALATAVHARAVGLEPHVVLSPQAPTPYARATLLAHAALGSVVHVVDGWDGSREAVRVRRELEAANGVEPYVIPMGGTNGIGAAGYVNAAFEVADQVPDVVYVTGGTLGTAVGLAIGFAAMGAPTRVVSIRVTPGEVANEEFARRVSAETVGILRSFDPGFPELAYENLELELRDDWFEPGYGVVTPQTLDAVAMARDLGLKFETTYTGKTFAALLADAATGMLQESRVLLWNTYNSAPMPLPGDVSLLAAPLREYVSECNRLFGEPEESPTDVVISGGDSE